MIIAGFGFRRLAALDSLLDAYRQAAGTTQIDGIATIASKASLRIFEELAACLEQPIFAVDPVDLVIQKTQSWSQKSVEKYNVGSVAEAVALAASGEKSKLLTARVISSDRMVTCAVARGYCA
ncbi:MAG: cobalamin biosynthesis protein [Aestuariivita sp.]|nr:cobalamin biosynthesis protein [Aestuariivita sp.]MCY4202672.1 cobalamin biosynthesis protein [Aestuariivita sp.]MCY4287308.1 cobalamin biosynthesis protein [Aestuariivita sp.]MCY4346541.1 cobalamin biosynthesis protein [Aestuariivita sp.]